MQIRPNNPCPICLVQATCQHKHNINCEIYDEYYKRVKLIHTIYGVICGLLTFSILLTYFINIPEFTDGTIFDNIITIIIIITSSIQVSFLTCDILNKRINCVCVGIPRWVKTIKPVNVEYSRNQLNHSHVKTV